MGSNALPAPELGAQRAAGTAGQHVCTGGRQGKERTGLVTGQLWALLVMALR